MNPDIVRVQADIIDEILEDPDFFKRIGETLGVGRLDFFSLPVLFLEAIFEKDLERAFSAADLPLDDRRNNPDTQELGQLVGSQLVFIAIRSGLGPPAVNMLEESSLSFFPIVKGDDPGRRPAADLVFIDLDDSSLAEKNLLPFLLAQLLIGQPETKPNCRTGNKDSENEDCLRFLSFHGLPPKR